MNDFTTWIDIAVDSAVPASMSVQKQSSQGSARMTVAECVLLKGLNGHGLREIIALIQLAAHLHQAIVLGFCLRNKTILS